MSFKDISIDAYGLTRWINERPWMKDAFDPKDFPNYSDWRNWRDNGNPLTGRPYTISDYAEAFKVGRGTIYGWIRFEESH